MADRIFGQKGSGVRESFPTLLNDGLAAPVQSLNFLPASESARLTINDWVAERTRQPISHLIPAGGVRDDLHRVLVNALCLKAPWERPFPVFSTSPQPVYPKPSGSRTVLTMLETSARGYPVEDGLTVLTLGYLGQGLQGAIILPDTGQTTDATAARIAPEHLARWAKRTVTARRSVTL